MPKEDEIAAGLEYSAEARRAYWDREIQQHLEYVSQNSAFYKRLFNKNGINISEPNIFHKIPFTSKDDLAQHNEDFLCVARNKIADYVTTSGTLGDPVAFYLSKKDLDRLAQNEMGSLVLAGCTEEDIFQLLTTMDKRFMAGLAYYLGVQALGAGMIRLGPGILQQQWESILKFKPTVLIAVPSFLISMIKYAKEHGIDVSQTSVKKAICIGEALHREDMEASSLSKRIKQDWDIELLSTYASTEGCTAFTACNENGCVHVQPELIYTEVVSDEGRQVKNGEAGEVVITPLKVEAMPLLRYRTGDICRYYDEPCSCGRTSPRLGPVIGRKQHMIKLKGTTIFPNMIIDVLNADANVQAFQIELGENDLGHDTVLIRCAMKNPELKASLEEALLSRLRVKPAIQLESVQEIRNVIFRENLRKPEILVDRRKGFLGERLGG